MVIKAYFSVLKNTNFTKLWISQVCSQLTNFLLSFAILIKTFQLTHSSAAVSIILVAFGLGTLFFGAFAGVYADRFDRKWILTIVNFAQALTVLLYIFFQDNFWALAGMTFVYSSINQFYLPAEAPSIPNFVPKDEILIANSYFAFTANGSMLVGFALAGPLAAWYGFKFLFLLGGILLLVAGFSTLSLPSLKSSIVKPKFFEKVWTEFKSGLQYFLENRPLLFPLLALLVAQLINGMLITLAPALVDKILRLDLERGSFVAVAPLALGIIVGALLLGLESKRLQKRQMIVLGFLGMGLAIASFGALPHVGNRTAFYFVAAFVAGIFNAHIFSPSHSILQSEAADSHRGRVYGALYVLLQAASTLPIFLVGILADLYSVPTVLAGMGIGLFLLGTCFIFLKKPYLT